MDCEIQTYHSANTSTTIELEVFGWHKKKLLQLCYHSCCFCPYPSVKGDIASFEEI